MMEVEKKLSKLHNKEYVLLTGNGTAAIAIALRALGLKNAAVAIPNNVCLNVPSGVYFSGNKVKYLDVSLNNLGLSVSSLKESIDQIDAVIAVHTYGAVCDIKEIQSLCKKHQIPLIEDFAVAQGAVCGSSPVGSFGDISIVSFGAGKMIDIGHGGAILTNDKGLFDSMAVILGEFKSFDLSDKKKIMELNNHYKNIYNSSYLSGEKEYCSAFLNKMVLDAKDSYLTSFDARYRDQLLCCLNKIEDNVARRDHLANEFLRAFQKFGDQLIEIFNPPQGSVFWRFNLFLKENRNELFFYLLNRKYKISSWYPSIDIFLEGVEKRSSGMPNSDWIGDHILNLWVNDEIDVNYVESVSNEIVGFLEESKANAAKL